MKNTKLTRKNATVSATYLPYSAYKRANELATAHKGEIGTTAEGNFKATFNSVKTAEKFVKEWTAEYNANRKPIDAPKPVTVPTPAKGKSNLVTVTVDGVKYTVDKSALVPTAPAKKTAPAPAKSGKKPTTKKADKTNAPKRTKGSAFDFGKIKGKTNTDKNKALHAALVGMGMKDSRSADYQAIWNARPWTK
jgi:hypothetical protein